MTDLNTFFLILNVVLWLIFIFLYYCLRKKKISFRKEEKKRIRSLLIFLALIPCVVFFQDVDFVFDCQKKTRRCDYYHSTFYDKELRLVKSYDLAAINEIKVVPRRRKKRTFFRLEFSGPFDRFEMPQSFLLESKAREQADRIALFLHTDSPRYEYKNIQSKDYGNGFSFIFAWTAIVAICGIFLMAEKLSAKQR